MKEEIQKTKEDIYRRAIDWAHGLQQTVEEKNNFYVTLEQLENFIKAACPCECGHQDPYGFVPEVGCPVHD